ncbi:MAG TPA: rod-binding protein [Xanthobacteraceae bacterium]|nr:rod-binding protein [Xanthobacteraceae bacterium]
MTSAAAQLGLSVAAIGDAGSAQAQSTLKFKGKAKVAAQEFEAMFLNSMFQHMFAGIDGEGPFGGSGALKVWRSLLTDQYARTFAKTGGIGIAAHVYDALLKQQGVSPS